MSNIFEHNGEINREDREKLLNQRGGILWFTGLSGSGKSTLARAVEKELFNRGKKVYVLDGDNLRFGLNADLGFSVEDRAENIRRASEVALLFADAGYLVVSALISPFVKDRENLREKAGDGRFLEVYMSAPLKTCEDRDVKGLYKKVREGEIGEFTGISSPYEAPLKPEISVDSTHESIEEGVNKVISYLDNGGYLNV